MVAKEEQLESSTESHSGDECDGLWKLKVFCPTIEGLDLFIALGKVPSGAIFVLGDLQLVQDKSLAHFKQKAEVGVKNLLVNSKLT